MTTADIFVDIAPNSPTGTFCVPSQGKSVCVQADRLRIRAVDVAVHNEAPPVTALNGHYASLDGVTDIQISLFDKPIHALDYIDKLDIIFKDLTAPNAPNAAAAGGDGPLRASLNMLFRVGNNCWQSDDGRICVTLKAPALQAGGSAGAGQVAPPQSAQVSHLPLAEDRVLWTREGRAGKKVILYQRINSTIYCLGCRTSSGDSDEITISAGAKEAISLPFLHSEGATKTFVVLSNPVGAACPFDSNYFAISLDSLRAQSIDFSNECSRTGEAKLRLTEEGGALVIAFVRGDQQEIVRRVR